MSKPIHNEHKQVMSLISPGVMTNNNMLPMNNQSLKDFDENTNSNIGKGSLITNNELKESNKNADSNSFDNTKQESFCKSKHMKKAASFEMKVKSLPKKDGSSHNNNNSISLSRNNNQDNDNNTIINNSHLLTISSQLMSSKKCVFVYIFLIIMSIFTFVYSIIDIFYSLNRIPLITCEVILCVVMTVDMIIRIILLVIYSNII